MHGPLQSQRMPAQRPAPAGEPCIRRSIWHTVSCWSQVFGRRTGLPTNATLQMCCMTAIAIAFRDSFITAGASGGIGEACAWRFAEAGCKLVLLARRTEKLTALQKKLQDEYRVRETCFTLVTDVLHGCTISCRPQCDHHEQQGISQRAQPEHMQRRHDVRTAWHCGVLCRGRGCGSALTRGAMLLWSSAGAHPHGHA